MMLIQAFKEYDGLQKMNILPETSFEKEWMNRFTSVPLWLRLEVHKCLIGHNTISIVEDDKGGQQRARQEQDYQVMKITMDGLSAEYAELQRIHEIAKETLKNAGLLGIYLNRTA
jgi:hypothetical protein